MTDDEHTELDSQGSVSTTCVGSGYDEHTELNSQGSVSTTCVGSGYDEHTELNSQGNMLTLFDPIEMSTTPAKAEATSQRELAPTCNTLQHTTNNITMARSPDTRREDTIAPLYKYFALILCLSYRFRSKINAKI
jgi:hypothetical protein